MYMRVQATAVAKTYVELGRWSDLATIRQALAATKSEVIGRAIGLDEVVELCKVRSQRPGAGRDRHDVRSQILSIVCAWDLSIESLDDQSDDCVASLAAFVAPARPMRVA